MRARAPSPLHIPSTIFFYPAAFEVKQPFA